MGGRMLPRRVFHAKPGSGSGVRLQSEVVNTASVPGSKSWTIQDISDRILDTSRTSPASLPDVDIPPGVRVSRPLDLDALFPERGRLSVMSVETRRRASNPIIVITDQDFDQDLESIEDIDGE